MSIWSTKVWPFCQTHWLGGLVGLGVGLLVGAFVGWLLALRGVDAPFILALTKACAWPVVVIVGLILLGQRIEELSLKHGDTEIRAKLIRLEQYLDRHNVPRVSLDECADRITDQLPLGAIHKAWNELVLSAERAVGAHGPIPFRKLVTLLLNADLIDAEGHYMLSQLRDIQRRAKRKPKRVTGDEAYLFTDLADRVRKQIEAKEATKGVST
jgi:hypothetical protein